MLSTKALSRGLSDSIRVRWSNLAVRVKLHLFSLIYCSKGSMRTNISLSLVQVLSQHMAHSALDTHRGL